MTKFIKEHYLVGHQPIVVVMTENRTPLQAWYINHGAKRLQRDDDYIFIIENDVQSRFMPEDAFTHYCAQRNICTDIPESDIQFTYQLASRRIKGASSVIPFPLPVVKAANDSSAPGNTGHKPSAFSCC
ncbi:MAG: hypothetical protein HYU57_00385 [Micavibrio aeruginosavorus]|nr:hypothetical protein [Micavibrio aeruginosavorus]